MPNLVEIENIEALRSREGIDDVELREAIRGLRIGDLVKLTFCSVTKAFAGETLLVRITSIRKHAFRGKLVTRPVTAGLSRLRVGFLVAFTRDHIHSLPEERPGRE